MLCQSCGKPIEPSNTGTVCWTCITPLLMATAKKSQQTTQKGTPMTTTTKPVDHGLDDHFYAQVDLQIEPDLGKTPGFQGERLSLKQTKDQDVQLVNGEITVVEQIVTTVNPTWGTTEYIYDYPGLKKELQKLATHVKQSGSTLKGHIIINNGINPRHWIRLVVENDKVVAQAALLGWPDGSKSPMPKFE